MEENHEAPPRALGLNQGDSVDMDDLTLQGKRFSVTFNVRYDGDELPHDAIQDESIFFDAEHPLLLPAVGDTVSMMWGGRRGFFTVVTRHFEYFQHFRGVNIVVTEIDPKEMSKRVADF